MIGLGAGIRKRGRERERERNMIFSNRSGNHVEAFRFKGEYCVDYSRH